MAIPARWAKEHCMHDGNGMGTSNSDPYPTTEAAAANNNISAAPPRFCSSLKWINLPAHACKAASRNASDSVGYDQINQGATTKYEVELKM